MVSVVPAVACLVEPDLEMDRGRIYIKIDIGRFVGQ